MAAEVVFVDWFMTLSDSKFWGHWATSEHPNHGLFVRIQDLWYADLVHNLDPWMRGDRDSEAFVAHVAGKLGVSDAFLWPDFIRSCQEMAFRSDAFSQLVRSVRATGKEVYIATDNMDSFSRWTVPAMGLDQLFDGILNSSRLRCIKGDRDAAGGYPFFRQFFERKGVAPDRCVLLDDGGNLAGIAAGTGMRCIRISSVEDLERELVSLS